MTPQTFFNYALLIFFFSFFSHSSFGQAPQGINYQAVARNSETGLELSNQSVFLSAKIRLNGPSGSIVYQENHDDITTNQFGLFSLQIGTGSPVQGDFSELDWGLGAHWLEIDVDAGNGLETLGAMQFVSVPYALFAETTGNVDDADADPQNELVQSLNYNPEDGNLTLDQEGNPLTVNIGVSETNNDNDPTNELIDDFVFTPETTELTITEAGESLSVNLEALINDADSDPSNEAIDNFSLSATNQLTIEEGDQTFSVDLQSLQEDADANPQNELISSFVLMSNNQLVITEAEPWSVNLSSLIDDADPNPSNELIDANGLSLDSDGILTISEGGTANQVDLSSLTEDEDWDKNDASTVVFVEDKNVGIGTSNPNARLEIVQTTNTNEELIKVTSPELDPVLSVNTNSVGIGTDNPTSTLDINGSVSVNTTILSTTGQSSYNVQPDDYIIIIRFFGGGADPFVMNMPDPSTCEGRVIHFTRIGQDGSDNLLIDFGSSTYDFTGSSTLSIIGGINFDAHSTFVSLGSSGWVRMNRL